MKSDKLKALMKEADALWSQAIHRSYRGRCLYTGGKGIDPHHVFLRRNKATRWELMNGVLLSREMHAWAHRDQKAFRDWIRGEMGFEAYDKLEKKSREVFRPTDRDMEAIIQGLTEWV